jgi:hypothetical protein
MINAMSGIAWMVARLQSLWKFGYLRLVLFVEMPTCVYFDSFDTIHIHK